MTATTSAQPAAPGSARVTAREWVRSKRADGVRELTRQQLAAELGVKPNTIEQGRKRGTIPNPDGYFGRTPWWSVQTVGKLIEQRAQPRRRTAR
jgi:hypothetical protein